VAAYEGQDVMKDSVSVNPIEHTAGCLKSETRYSFLVDWTGTVVASGDDCCRYGNRAEGFWLIKS
jgi:hypothetical protein